MVAYGPARIREKSATSSPARGPLLGVPCVIAVPHLVVRLSALRTAVRGAAVLERCRPRVKREETWLQWHLAPPPDDPLTGGRGHNRVARPGAARHPNDRPCRTP